MQGKSMKKKTTVSSIVPTAELISLLLHSEIMKMLQSR